jgi:hypothetical protein
MSDDREQVVLDGMWRTIKALHAILVATAPQLEWFYGVTPDEHKLRAAQVLDTFNNGLNSCDALLEPMRKIMEGDQ